MAFPRRSSRTPRSRFTLGLLLLTAVTLLVLDLPGTGPLDPIRSAAASVLRPVRSAGDAVFRPIGNGWKGAFGYGQLKDENAKLKARLAARQSERARVTQLQQLVDELNKLQKFEAPGERTVSARIVSGPLSSFDHSLQIDRGTGQGVERGMPVIVGGIDRSAAGAQVMGRVVKTRTNSATVELLTEPSFQLGVRIAGGAAFVAKGQGRGKDLVLEGVPDNALMTKGASIETSGIDRSAFPANLQVGRITSVRRTAPGQQAVHVHPTADLSSIYVKVVLREAAS